jgi:hypothetical protein
MTGRTWIASGIAAALVYGGIAAGPAGGRTPRPLTFDGHCQFSGLVKFRPALSTTARTVRQSISAPGACDGTLRDRHGFTHQLNGAKVTYAEKSVGQNASCANGTAVGSGSLRFHWGKLRFAFAEKRVGGVVSGTATGASGGSATGFGGVSESENPAHVLQECAGSGIRQVRIDVSAVTTPEISG